MRVTAVTLLLVAVSWVGLQPQQSEDNRSLVFTRATVIDATGSPEQPDTTVVIVGNRIAALGPDGQIQIPSNARVVNAQGYFLIPGLWDMHTHAFMRKNKILPLLTLHLYVAHGVTGIRDMGDQGVPDDFGLFPYVQDFEWRQAVTAGVAVGPRLVLAGVIVDGPETLRDGWASIHDVRGGREQVRHLSSLNADLIKVYDRMPRDAYFAIVDEARELGLTVAGHVPHAISSAEASDAGQRSIEHLTGVLVSSSTEEERLRVAVKERGVRRNIQALVDTYSEEMASDLFERFVENSTFHVPTLVRGTLDQMSMTDPRVVKYFSPALREEYGRRFVDRHPRDPREDPNAQLSFEMEQRLVREMHRAGVKMLAGTDTPFFGSGLHDELGELVRAGLEPMAAIQAATRNAADYLGRLDTMGTLEVGKVADMVLLEDNPLVDIRNTMKIAAVVSNGRFFDREALDSLLAGVEAAVQEEGQSESGTDSLRE